MTQMIILLTFLIFLRGKVMMKKAKIHRRLLNSIPLINLNNPEKKILSMMKSKTGPEF